MNILINGIMGFMGREVYKLCEIGYLGAKFAAGVDVNAPIGTELNYYRNVKEADAELVDCIIDFSIHTATEELLSFAKEKKLPIVLATTGHTDAEIGLIKKASEDTAIFYSANMSVGVALLLELCKTAVVAMPTAEIEIIEKHHTRKIDAPSGTAFMLADMIREVRTDAYTVLGRHGQGKRDKNEIGIHAVRCGNTVGEHEVIIATENQTVTLCHRAHSRTLFAEGAILAAKFLLGKKNGLYDMKSLLSENG